MLGSILLKIKYYLDLKKFSKIRYIPTHLTEIEKVKLFESARNVNGIVFVEIGSYIGASSCFIAEGIKKSKKSATLYCVDTWQNDAMSEGKQDTYQKFLENTKDYANIIVPLQGTSKKIAETFDKKIDFLFIDGDHSYEGVKTDVNAWFLKLNSGAIILFHDVGWAEGVQRVIKEDITPNVKKEGRLPNLYWAWIK